jgi:hypothetical protein
MWLLDWKPAERCVLCALFVPDCLDADDVRARRDVLVDQAPTGGEMMVARHRRDESGGLNAWR